MASRPTVHVAESRGYVIDVDQLTWIPAEQAAGGAGGGGDASAANQVTGNASLASIDGKLTNPLPVSLASVPTHGVTGTFWQAAQPITDNAASLTVDAPVGTPAFVRLSDGSAAITTLPVSLASVPSHNVTNAGTFPVQVARPGTGTRTSVAAAAADTSLLAANPARFGFVVTNDSDKTMYIALGTAAASLTSYTAPVPAGQVYEVPFSYSGAVRAIWATGPTGSARITELTT